MRGTLRYALDVGERFTRVAIVQYLSYIVAVAHAAGRTHSMLGYPEGTRHTEDKPSLPLKTGMLRMAHRCKANVQIVIACGKGEILQEKKLRFRYGARVTSYASKVFKPSGTLL